jgi:hypothetical protein
MMQSPTAASVNPSADAQCELALGIPRRRRLLRADGDAGEDEERSEECRASRAGHGSLHVTGTIAVQRAAVRLASDRRPAPRSVDRMQSAAHRPKNRLGGDRAIGEPVCVLLAHEL